MQNGDAQSDHRQRPVGTTDPLDTQISCVFSKKLVAAIKRKGNHAASRAEVIRDLLDPDKVQELLREDAEHQEKFRRMHRRN